MLRLRSNSCSSLTQKSVSGDQQVPMPLMYMSASDVRSAALQYCAKSRQSRLSCAAAVVEGGAATETKLFCSRPSRTFRCRCGCFFLEESRDEASLLALAFRSISARSAWLKLTSSKSRLCSAARGALKWSRMRFLMASSLLRNFSSSKGAETASFLLRRSSRRDLPCCSRSKRRAFCALNSLKMWMASPAAAAAAAVVAKVVLSDFHFDYSFLHLLLQ